MKKLNKLFLTASLVVATALNAEIAVVVNSANNAKLSKDDIERIYLGKTKLFPGGQEADVVGQKVGTGITDEFTRKALNKSANQYKVYWSKRIFTGKGNAPKPMENDAEVIEYVVNNSNAIGYVDASKVNDSVKVIATF